MEKLQPNSEPKAWYTETLDRGSALNADSLYYLTVGRLMFPHAKQIQMATGYRNEATTTFAYDLGIWVHHSGGYTVLGDAWIQGILRMFGKYLIDTGVAGELLMPLPGMPLGAYYTILFDDSGALAKFLETLKDQLKDPKNKVSQKMVENLKLGNLSEADLGKFVDQLFDGADTRIRAALKSSYRKGDVGDMSLLQSTLDARLVDIFKIFNGEDEFVSYSGPNIYDHLKYVQDHTFAIGKIRDTWKKVLNRRGQLKTAGFSGGFGCCLRSAI